MRFTFQIAKRRKGPSERARTQVEKFREQVRLWVT